MPDDLRQALSMLEREVGEIRDELRQMRGLQLTILRLIFVLAVGFVGKTVALPFLS